MDTASPYHRNLGLAGGSLWLIAIGTVFATWSLYVAHSAIANLALVLWFVAAFALIIFGIQLVRRVRSIPRKESGDPKRGLKLARQFGIIVAAEGLACTAIALGCISMHHWKLIVPLCLIVVGLHFLPLARLFEVPRYYVTGLLFCLIPIVTMLAVSSSAHIGDAVTWVAVPATGCAMVAIATGWAGLREVKLFVNTFATTRAMGLG